MPFDVLGFYLETRISSLILTFPASNEIMEGGEGLFHSAIQLVLIWLFNTQNYLGH